MSVFTNRFARSPDEADSYVRALHDLVGDRDPMEVLRDTPGHLRSAVEELSEEALAAPEAPGKWSIRHVVRHLTDSEIVWAYRLRMVMAQDRPPLTGYDQDAWAERLGYDETSMEETLEELEVLRGGNLRLLERASEEDLDRVGVHGERGEETLRDMIPLYAGHDLVHLRQIERIRSTVEE